MSSPSSDPVASTSALNQPEEELAFPPLTRAAVDACAFKSWYPNFKRVTPKATILDLEDGFIEYLKADGLFLPDDDDDEGSNDGYVLVQRRATNAEYNLLTSDRSRSLSQTGE